MMDTIIIIIIILIIIIIIIILWMITLVWFTINKCINCKLYSFGVVFILSLFGIKQTIYKKADNYYKEKYQKASPIKGNEPRSRCGPSPPPFPRIHLRNITWESKMKIETIHTNESKWKHTNNLNSVTELLETQYSLVFRTMC